MELINIINSVLNDIGSFFAPATTEQIQKFIHSGKIKEAEQALQNALTKSNLNQAKISEIQNKLANVNFDYQTSSVAARDRVRRAKKDAKIKLEHDLTNQIKAGAQIDSDIDKISDAINNPFITRDDVTEAINRNKKGGYDNAKI